MMFAKVSPVLALVALASAAAVHRDCASDTQTAALPGSWYHDDHHPAHVLFARQAPAPSGFPTVGSPAWSAPYPVSTPDANAMPQAWKDALSAAVQAGKIPNLAPSQQSAPGTNPFYPGLDPNSPQVCSGTYKCRIPGTTEIWDAPPGVMAIGFDDGPLPTSDKLYAFLQQNHIRATHFYIGVNIINNPKEFSSAFGAGDDIAVHTWTHPYMTTLSNADVVAQLGWTLQLIYQSTGGRLARFWRPPYGDTDVRVSAIAQAVFGLTTIVWNQDSEDWSLGEAGGTTPAAISTNFQHWLTGPKTPGLIVLEHELSEGSAQAFIDAYPVILQNNWTLMSTATVAGGATYQNALNSTAPITSSGASAPPSSSAASTSVSTSSSASVAPATVASSSAAVKSSTSVSPSPSPSPSPSSATAPNNQSNQKSGALPRVHSSALALGAALVLGGVLSS
ncbi:glycoside hydrolase/deacetylase [Artomyces pyxidatus]|uniref:Glycoside hydrolase/deacetylase n=1 Tax=Artomyces pyxidatus TaxID=48021 RepID=A0ACB8TK18_9AGAM|nr:glycoside hydrolase/deacetylase [Artomyces pyxidatus]